ncbi:MAG: fimbrillin family protein, partial [Muribaculaceae bacterium]|nr:fimbrillin family protein [Bacteroidales bacterium]MDY6186571.1 fimbrillin family protein [Muribaculaceae bacterium]
MTLKHILTFSSAIALSTLYLCSCAGEDGPDFTDSRELQISGTFVGERAPQSRVNGSLWEADTIGVYITAPFSYAIVKDYQNLPYYTTSTGTTAFFTKIGKAIAVSDLTAGSNSIIAYAPYTPNDPSRIDNSSVGIAIDTRKQNTRELQRKIDIVRVQKGIQADWISSGKIDNLVFKHQMSKIVVKIKADPA